MSTTCVVCYNKAKYIDPETCNAYCGAPCFTLVAGVVKRDREEEDEDPFEELERLLAAARDQVRLIDAGQDDAVRASLDQTGVALVRVDPGQANLIARKAGRHMAATYDQLTEATRARLVQGDFAPFFKEWNKRGAVETGVWGRSSGMCNKPAITPDARPLYTHPITKTVHRRNQVTADNNLDLWLTLGMRPTAWLNDRVQVSEDGLKIMDKVKYSPTGVHYDGQLGEEGRRIQIIYTTDSGPIRLFAVAGSHGPRVRQLIEQIAGIKTHQGFGAHKKVFDSHPRLRALLYRYGVAVPGNGLLAFVANVWHYEAMSAMSASGIVYVDEHAEPVTSTSNVFRIYCGIVSVPPGELIKDLIVFAYLREHAWIMDPYASSNKRHPLFVNEKSTQNWKGAIGNEDAAAFATVANVSMDDMKAYLRDHVTRDRLALHGLVPGDLNSVRPLAIDLTGE